MTSVEERLNVLRAIARTYRSRMDEMAGTISREMGAPLSLSCSAQAPAGLRHLEEAISVLTEFPFEEVRGSTLMRKEPIGVCGLITPWNWPMNQIVCKVAPALAAGCTLVLKPSELAPLSAHLFIQILDEAGVPPGVVNLINGRGDCVGTALSSHPNVDMISFTGSVRAGIAVATAAAPTVKRVAQELGGKSPYIVLDDAAIENAVADCVQLCFRNSGQSCNAPTRLLVPARDLDAASLAAKRVCERMKVGDPFAEDTALGPLANKVQFDKVQRFIEKGIEEGATLVAGGLGRPEPLSNGYFVKPTVFSRVHNTMTIAREEIFGPVLSIMSYEDEKDAIQIANDTPYGLSAYVTSGDVRRAASVAKQLRAGNVHINGARLDFRACFGGYKQSGNGREWGAAGLEEFLELKAMLGYPS